MHKKLASFILLTGLLFGVTACAPIPSKVLSVDMSYSGKEVTLDNYATLTISLDSDPPIGYIWNEKAGLSAEGIIRQTSHESNPTEDPLGIKPGTEVWTFSALESGTCTITLQNKRTLKEGSTSPDTFTLTVVVR